MSPAWGAPARAAAAARPSLVPTSATVMKSVLVATPRVSISSPTMAHPALNSLLICFRTSMSESQKMALPQSTNFFLVAARTTSVSSWDREPASPAPLARSSLCLFPPSFIATCRRDVARTYINTRL
ncbi:hypothetical protein B0H19DRAFT_607742 [Mycena capillaripes]|nr:hypothetical protein B0H19DRAFT_607742 [Mycena capillaripes]